MLPLSNLQVVEKPANLLELQRNLAASETSQAQKSCYLSQKSERQERQVVPLATPLPRLPVALATLVAGARLLKRSFAYLLDELVTCSVLASSTQKWIAARKIPVYWRRIKLVVRLLRRHLFLLVNNGVPSTVDV